MPDPLVSQGPQRVRAGDDELTKLTVAGRIAGPARSAIFLLLFFGIEVICRTMATVSIVVPCALIPGYRDRFFRRFWNWIVAYWGRSTWRCLRGSMGLRLEADGEIPAGRFLIISNHQSTVDIPLLFSIFRGKNLKFVVKKGLLRRGSIVGTALRQAGFGVVEFTNPRKTLAGLAVYCRELEGWDGSAVLFPEGVRSFDGNVGEFQPSGLRLLAGRTGLRILPVVLDGAWRARSMGQFARLSGRTIRARVLPPLGPFDRERSEELEALPGRIEQLIRSELDRLRSEGSS